MRLLDGVLFTVPYNISSCVCLVFFSCYFQGTKIGNNHIVHMCDRGIHGKVKF